MKIKKFGCVISSAIFVAYKFIQFAFNVFAKGLSSLLATTGLIVPATYFLFGVVLTALFGFDVTDGSVNATIYKTGMAISFVIALLVFIYNIFIRPVKKATRHKNAKHKLDNLEEPAQPARASASPAYVVDEPAYVTSPAQMDTRSARGAQASAYPTQTYDDLYAGTHMPSRSISGREMPLIYESRTYPGIIVYEYSDCFRLYREENGKLTLVKVQPKD